VLCHRYGFTWMRPKRCRWRTTLTLLLLPLCGRDVLVITQQIRQPALQASPRLPLSQQQHVREEQSFAYVDDEAVFTSDACILGPAPVRPTHPHCTFQSPSITPAHPPPTPRMGAL
jgi:hypothetical protein